MAIILPNFTDITLANHSNAFVKIRVNSSDTDFIIELSFWTNFSAYKNGGKRLNGDQPIILNIPKRSRYEDKTLVSRLADVFDIGNVLGRTPSIAFYDDILKNINGTEESITFHTGETTSYQHIVVVEDQQTIEIIESPVVDIILYDLKGIDFTNATDSFTQEEIDLQINGLLNPDDAKIIFNETLEVRQIYSLPQSTWFNQ